MQSKQATMTTSSSKNTNTGKDDGTDGGWIPTGSSKPKPYSDTPAKHGDTKPNKPVVRRRLSAAQPRVDRRALEEASHTE